MKLSTWNWSAFAVQLIVAIAIIIYFAVKKGDINFNTTLYNIRITDFNVDNPNSSVITTTPALDVTGTAMKVLVVVYFMFTALFHLLYATDFFGSGVYTRAVSNMNQYWRWIEYSISSTIITFLVAIVCGVKSLDAIILLVIMNIGIMLCGQISEAAITKPGGKSIAIVAVLIGWILLLGIFGILLKNFFMGLADADTNGFKVPTYVYFIIFPLLIWYALFGFVNLWWVLGKEHTIQKYLKIEKAYIILSFLSKLNIGVFVAFGLTRPRAEEKSSE
jgi:hypothetical protein